MQQTTHLIAVDACICWWAPLGNHPAKHTVIRTECYGEKRRSVSQLFSFIPIFSQGSTFSSRRPIPFHLWTINLFHWDVMGFILIYSIYYFKLCRHLSENDQKWFHSTNLSPNFLQQLSKDILPTTRTMKNYEPTNSEEPIYSPLLYGFELV